MTYNHLEQDKSTKEMKKMYLKNIIKLYFAPIVSLSVFFFTFMFVVFPTLSRIFTKIEEIQKKEILIETNNKKLYRLSLLNRDLDYFMKVLNRIDILSPEKKTTYVLDFRNKIISIARRNNLNINLQRMSEVDLNDLQVSSDSGTFELVPIKLREIPSYFDVEGRYENLLNFINSIFEVDNFVVIKNIDLFLRNENNSRPRTSISISKYFFDYDDIEKVKEYYSQISIFTDLDREFINNVILKE
ncbi:MAG: hypothetical protein NZZ41_06285 [Candidatus Dojkabacteria bacterium]|nr:hypothetical protein [Candidatus Dojkabacteria bacterium]